MSVRITLNTPQSLGQVRVFDGLSADERRGTDFFSADLNADGVSEVFLQTSNAQATVSWPWRTSYLNIFEFKSGKWGNATKQFLQSSKVYGSAIIIASDFNGDGHSDIFSATNPDKNDFFLPNDLFLSTPAGFVHSEFSIPVYQHDVTQADINQDGFSDLLITDYGPNTGIAFGGPDGLKFYGTEWRGPFGASAISAADFLGDGTTTIVTADDGFAKGGGALYSWGFDSSGKLQFTPISVLPAPRFELSEWAPYRFGDATAGHEVKTLPFDFTNDGLIDVLVMGRPAFTDGTWPEYSEIQFLKNMGAGKFIDVTDSVLIGYDRASHVAYHPTLIDVNGDGRLDIFISGPDYSSYNSTALLVQYEDGTFVDVGRAKFSEIWAKAVALTKSLSSTSDWIFSDWGNTQRLVKGGDGKWYVFSNVSLSKQGNKVHYQQVIVTPIDINDSLAADQGTPGDDELLGTPGADSMSGLAGRDRMSGLNGNDNLSGGTGNDSLLSGGGDDSLSGGLGNDSLVGGGGADVFVFDTALARNTDRIADFNPAEGDRIRLDDSVFARFTGLQVAAANLVVAAGSAAKAQDADDYLILNTTTGALLYDADGSGKGKAVQFATLVGVSKLSAADFEVV